MYGNSNLKKNKTLLLHKCVLFGDARVWRYCFFSGAYNSTGEKELSERLERKQPAVSTTPKGGIWIPWLSGLGRELTASQRQKEEEKPTGNYRSKKDCLVDRSLRNCISGPNSRPHPISIYFGDVHCRWGHSPLLNFGLRFSICFNQGIEKER